MFWTCKNTISGYTKKIQLHLRNILKPVGDGNWVTVEIIILDVIYNNTFLLNLQLSNFKTKSNW